MDLSRLINDNGVYLYQDDNYIQLIHSYVSNNPKEYLKTARDKLYRKDMSFSEFEGIRRSLIAEEVRDCDDKYSAPSKFGDRLQYTENYSDLDIYKKITYERFMEILNMLRFDNYTMGKVKQLKK